MTKRWCNEYDCGCKIVSEFKDGKGFKTIEWCPLHKTAPALLVACKDILPLIEALDTKEPYFNLICRDKDLTENLEVKEYLVGCQSAVQAEIANKVKNLKRAIAKAES